MQVFSGWWRWRLCQRANVSNTPNDLPLYSYKSNELRHNEIYNKYKRKLIERKFELLNIVMCFIIYNQHSGINYYTAFMFMNFGATTMAFSLFHIFLNPILQSVCWNETTMPFSHKNGVPVIITPYCHHVSLHLHPSRSLFVLPHFVFFTIRLLPICFHCLRI